MVFKCLIKVRKHVFDVYITKSMFLTTMVQQYGRVKAKFHYTGPTGPARSLSETRTDQRSFSEIRVVRGRAGPVRCGRARVVEFSYNAARRTGPSAAAQTWFASMSSTSDFCRLSASSRQHWSCLLYDQVVFSNYPLVLQLHWQHSFFTAGRCASAVLAMARCLLVKPCSQLRRNFICANGIFAT